jgi:hypothetical protein
VRRGLVLAGGGAKGAYTFGCIKAFEQAEIHFDAVAGTSVGALNALLLASDALEAGEEIWRSLGPSSIYPLRPIRTPWIPETLRRWLALAVRPLAILIAFVVSVWSVVPTPGERILRPVIGIVLLIPFFFGVGLLYGTHVGMATALGLTLLETVPPWVLRSRERMTGYSIALIGVAYGGSLAFLALRPLYSFLEGISTYRIIQIVAELALLLVGTVVVLLLSFAVDSAMLRVVGRVQARFGTMLSSSPLAATVRDLLEKHQVSVPCFVTIARPEVMWDPDFSGWYAVIESSGLAPAPGSGMTYKPSTDTLWTGEYVDLQSINAETAASLLVASAALPFGIVESVSIGEYNFGDGGVFDNCPVFPLLALNLDEIYVVLLQPVDSGSDVLAQIGATEESWRIRERDLRVLGVTIPEQKFGRLGTPVPDTSKLRKGAAPVALPYAEPPTIPRIRVFAPKERLGGFLTGTLNFRAAYAVRLMNRGYCDTLKELGQPYEQRVPS